MTSMYAQPNYEVMRVRLIRAEAGQDIPVIENVPENLRISKRLLANPFAEISRILFSGRSVWKDGELVHEDDILIQDCVSSYRYRVFGDEGDVLDCVLVDA